MKIGRPDGKPDEAYKAAVKKRFVQWARDTCMRQRDQEWLDYQEEIRLRHTPAKKNKTEGAHAPDVVPLRHLLAFAGPAILDARPFFAKKGHSAAEYRTHAPGLGEERVADLGAVEPSLRSRRSLVRVERRQADWVLTLLEEDADVLVEGDHVR